MGRTPKQEIDVIEPPCILQTSPQLSGCRAKRFAT